MTNPRYHRFMIRRGLWLVALAVVPWFLACLISLGEWALFDHSLAATRQTYRDLFLTPNILIPVGVFLAVAGAAGLRGRGRITATGPHWVAGAWLTLLSSSVISIVSFSWGGAYALGYMAIWAVLSGYIWLMWIAGAYGWRYLVAPEAAHKPSTPMD